MLVAISTTGSTGIQVSYVRRTTAFDSGENLVVEWSIDGSNWNLIESTQATSWGPTTFSPGAGADNNPGFRIRFTTNANKNNEKAFVDDVEVTGV